MRRSVIQTVWSRSRDSAADQPPFRRRKHRRRITIGGANHKSARSERALRAAGAVIREPSALDHIEGKRYRVRISAA